MMLELHRRSDGKAMLVNMDFVMKIFPDRYGKSDGAVLRFGEGTDEVRESVEQIKAALENKGARCP
jgi:hypothetical protein